MPQCLLEDGRHTSVWLPCYFGDWIIVVVCQMISRPTNECGVVTLTADHSYDTKRTPSDPTF